LLSKEAVLTFFTFKHTDYASKGMPKAATERGTFICGQQECSLAFDGEGKSRETEILHAHPAAGRKGIWKAFMKNCVFTENCVWKKLHIQLNINTK